MLKIRSIEAHESQFPLEHPYTIAYSSTDKAAVVFLKLEADNGLVGLGSAGPDEHVTGETPGSILLDIEQVVEPLLKGVDAMAYRYHLCRVAQALKKSPSTLACVDIALHDLWAKALGFPLWRLLGPYRNRVLTSVTIGISDEGETARQARSWVKKGFRCLKVKGGKNWEEDVARLKKIREIPGSTLLIRFDANQGYSLEETQALIRNIQGLGIEFVEQPTPKDRPDWLEKLAASGAAVMADEALVTFEDALELIDQRKLRLLNVKLMKVGGILGAQRLLSLAADRGVSAMMGCMDESALGISAGLALSLSEPAIKYVDLDGHIGMLGDPYASAIQVERGELIPNDRPGLG